MIDEERARLVWPLAGGEATWQELFSRPYAVVVEEFMRECHQHGATSGARRLQDELDVVTGNTVTVAKLVLTLADQQLVDGPFGEPLVEAAEGVTQDLSPGEHVFRFGVLFALWRAERAGVFGQLQRYAFERAKEAEGRQKGRASKIWWHGTAERAAAAFLARNPGATLSAQVDAARAPLEAALAKLPRDQRQTRKVPGWSAVEKHLRKARRGPASGSLPSVPERWATILVRARSA